MIMTPLHRSYRLSKQEFKGQASVLRQGLLTIFRLLSLVVHHEAKCKQHRDHMLYGSCMVLRHRVWTSRMHCEPTVRAYKAS
jgi:hypothetical protein